MITMITTIMIIIMIIMIMVMKMTIIMIMMMIMMMMKMISCLWVVVPRYIMLILKFESLTSYSHLLCHWLWFRICCNITHCISCTPAYTSLSLPFSLFISISLCFCHLVSTNKWIGVMRNPWASCKIRKMAGCACAGNAGNVFPATDFKGNRLLAIPACIRARASRTCHDACRNR